jgi:nitrate reductase gamma subunit
MNAALLALLIVGGAVVYAVVGVLVCRRFTRRHVAEGHNDVLVPVFLTAGVIYAVLLGFMVVAVWETYNAAHENAAEEAALLVPMYRESELMAPEKGVEMRKHLHEYAETVIKNEWPMMAKGSGKASLENRRAVRDIIAVFGTLAPATDVKRMVDEEFLRTLSLVNIDKNKRQLQASESMSWIMWLGAIGGGAIVVGMSFLLYMDRRWFQVVTVSIMSGLIGLLLFMMTVLSWPFVGPLALDPAPFEASLKAFDAIDAGN